MPERLAVPEQVPVMPQRLQVTPERQAAIPVMPARLPVPTTPRPTAVPQRLPVMPERLPVPQRFPAVPERQTPQTALVDSDRRVVPERLPVPATPTPLPQRLPVMPERLAVPMRENGQSRRPKNLEMLAFLRRPALTFLEEEEGEQGNSIIITVTGEPRVNPRSLVTIFVKYTNHFLS